MARPSCYNRPDFLNYLVVPKGYSVDGRRISVHIPHTMSKGCKQWGPAGEAKLKNWDCAGCKHKPTKEIKSDEKAIR